MHQCTRGTASLPSTHCKPALTSGVGPARCAQHLRKNCPAPLNVVMLSLTSWQFWSAHQLKNTPEYQLVERFLLHMIDSYCDASKTNAAFWKQNIFVWPQSCNKHKHIQMLFFKLCELRALKSTPNVKYNSKKHCFSTSKGQHAAAWPHPAQWRQVVQSATKRKPWQAFTIYNSKLTTSAGNIVLRPEGLLRLCRFARLQSLCLVFHYGRTRFH